MYFRQLKLSRRSKGGYFIKWDDPNNLYVGSTIEDERDWDYNISSNKYDFKLVLIK